MERGTTLFFSQRHFDLYLNEIMDILPLTKFVANHPSTLTLDAGQRQILAKDEVRLAHRRARGPRLLSPKHDGGHSTSLNLFFGSQFFFDNLGLMRTGC